MLAACQPQLNSSLPQGQAGYDAIRPAVEEENETAYLLQAGDVVTVNVFQEPDLSQNSIAIDRNGNLYLPLIGQVRAAGHTQTEISHAIEQAYGKEYLKNPRVAVIVNEALTSTISVEGEVQQPGVYEIEPGATLLTAMALAHSPKRTAKYDEVLVFRTINGQRMGARFDITDIRAGRSPDPQVLSGDVIVVGFSALRGIYTDILTVAPLLNVFTRF